MNVKNINHKPSLLLIIIMIFILLFAVCFFFGNGLLTRNDNTKEMDFIQEFTDAGILNVDEATANYYSGHIKTCPAVFEDEYVRIKLQQYILYEDLVLAKFSVEKISDEELVADKSSWNLKKNVTFDSNGNISSGKGGYTFSLLNKNNDYYDNSPGATAINDADEGLEVYIKTYILEGNEAAKYVVDNGQKEVEFPLEITETAKIVIKFENHDFILTPHLLFTYNKPEFDKLEIEYSDGEICTVIDNINNYSTLVADEKNMWFFISIKNRYRTEDITKIYLDGILYSLDDDRQAHIN